MKNDTSNFIHEHLINSDIFKDYETAFGEATGLPLVLSPVEDWHLAHHGKQHENPFCSLIATHSKACSACLRVQHELIEGPQETRTALCFAGMCETAVPLCVGDNVIGYLRTGEVLLKKPTKTQFKTIAHQLREWGLESRLKEFEDAFFQTRTMAPKHYDSIVQLLKIFAEHLSLVANQISLQVDQAEPPCITRARQYIDERQGEDLSLEEVSKAVHMSTFYFCKRFRQAVGCTFTEYLTRTRIETAKRQLANPNARVSEVAFDSGFQSITHFNRSFKMVVGKSPTEYRTSLSRMVSDRVAT